MITPTCNTYLRVFKMLTEPKTHNNKHCRLQVETLMVMSPIQATPHSTVLQ